MGRRARSSRAVVVAGGIALLAAVGAAAWYVARPHVPTSAAPAPVAGADAVPLRTLPGAQPLPEDVAGAVRAAVAEERARGDVPRTRHLEPDGTATYTNRLVLEPSPYLRQHAHNPVDWYPWGDEAFARARTENKPVLLSVGYSTCHWCHVMEEESFEDDEIARFLNEHYVAIKVDRERRPDVDGVYMSAVLTMTGSGGWPMTVWLTAERQPFYAGTYFPPHDGDRGQPMGFLTLLQRLAAAQREDPARVAAHAAAIAGALAAERAAAPEALDDVALRAASDAAVGALRDAFDAEHGGFGQAPKFPRSVALEFLLRHHRRTGEATSLEMVTRTLAAMADGGIRDQLGGGFHRYATDAQWLVPHFEKMLYDQALLAEAYVEAAQASGRTDLAQVARGILDDVARDMTGPEGAFCSAIDADSEGGEGRFYTWTPAEIAAVLGTDAGRRFAARYGAGEAGSFHGRSILHVAMPLDELAAQEGMDVAALTRELARSRAALLQARAARPRPLRDGKIVAAWNGLMISAFARAALALGDPGYAAAAARAGDVVVGRMMTPDGRLHRSLFAGRADGTGFLDDYADVESAMLDLYEATADVRWLGVALALQRALDGHFRDAAGGGYFATPDDGEVLLVRDKPDSDNVEPSGNAVAAGNLLRLAALTGDDRYGRAARDVIDSAGAGLRQDPDARPAMLSAVEFLLDVPKEIVVVKPDAGASVEPFLAALRAMYLPHRVLAVAVAGDDLARQEALVPLFTDRTALHGRVTAYVCERRVCDLPTTDPETFARQLRRTSPPHALSAP